MVFYFILIITAFFETPQLSLASGMPSESSTILPDSATYTRSYLYYPYVQEIIAGYTFGQLGWCLGATLGKGIGKTNDAASITGYALYGLGTSIGVWWVGNHHFEGKYFHTLVGTVLLPSLLLLIKENPRLKLGTEAEQNINDVIHFSLPLGAFIGYNLSVARENRSKH